PLVVYHNSNHEMAALALVVAPVDCAANVKVSPGFISISNSDRGICAEPGLWAAKVIKVVPFVTDVPDTSTEITLVLGEIFVKDGVPPSVAFFTMV
ncbi:hypothetical protein, partial [Paenibacillus thiaminolyticus]